MPKFVLYVIAGSLSDIIDLLTLNTLFGINTNQWLEVTIAFAVGFVINLNAHSVFAFVSPLTRTEA